MDHAFAKLFMHVVADSIQMDNRIRVGDLDTTGDGGRRHLQDWPDYSRHFTTRPGHSLGSNLSIRSPADELNLAPPVLYSA